MLEMYELCMRFKNYKEAEVKLLEFQKSLEAVSWSRCAPSYCLAVGCRACCQLIVEMKQGGRSNEVSYIIPEVGEPGWARPCGQRPIACREQGGFLKCARLSSLC